MGNWNTGGGGGSAGDFDDSFNEAMGYNSVDDADSRDSGDYSMTADEARTAGVPTGPSGGSEDPFAGTVGIAAPQPLPSGVVDYTSPNLISSLTSPRSVPISEMTAYGSGLNISPLRKDQVSFAGGSPLRTVDPLAGPANIEFDMGRAPVGYDDRNFLEKAVQGIAGIPDFQNQRMVQYDPLMNSYRTFAEGGVRSTADDRFDRGERSFLPSDTLAKTSDNFFTDLLANALASKTGASILTGVINSKDYVPLTGGEKYLYQTGTGGLLDIDSLRPYSEVEASQAGIGGDGGDGSDQPLIIPEEVAAVDERGEPTAFPEFTPREYKYQPFTSKFYTIPSRFTQPNGLLV